MRGIVFGVQGRVWEHRELGSDGVDLVGQGWTIVVRVKSHVRGWSSRQRTTSDARSLRHTQPSSPSREAF